MSVTIGYIRARTEADLDDWLAMMKAENFPKKVVIPTRDTAYALISIHTGWAPMQPGELEQRPTFAADKSRLPSAEARQLLQACREREAAIGGASREVFTLLLDGADVIVPDWPGQQRRIRSGPLAGRHVRSVKSWQSSLFALFEDLLGPTPPALDPNLVREAVALGQALAPALELVRTHRVMLDIAW